MSLLNQLGSALESAAGQAAAQALPGMLSAVLTQTKLGSLQGLIAQLQAGGLQQQVQSWLGNGSNLPVTAEQLRAALGDSHVQQLAQQFGVPVNQVLDLLAKELPGTVDAASPNGTLQAS
ncbi:MAG TPA: YidB family protein [Pseudolabrys sp.]|nr:YidB family protein [Pseudolabrys sp.]